jgi:diguanylate cyclase
LREMPPITSIKIDQSFIAGLGQNESDAAVVGALITLAQALDLSCVAEGIETESQLDWVRNAGCDTGQGYYFSRPFPPESLTEGTHSSSSISS